MSARDILVFLLLVVIVATVFGVDWRFTSPVGLVLIVLIILALTGRL